MAKIRKSLIAGFGAAVAATISCAQDGKLDWSDGLIILGSGVSVGWTAWRVPNKTA